jgi:hypothetical protein
VQPIGPPGQVPAGAAGPSPDPATAAGGNYTIDQLTLNDRNAVDAANANVDKIWQQIKPLQTQYQNLTSKTIPDPTDPTKTIPNPNYDATTAASAILPGGPGDQLTQQLNGLYTNLAQANSTLETANTNLSNGIENARKGIQLDPAQATYYTNQGTQAAAQANYLSKEGDVLEAGSQGQRDLVVAQQGQARDQGKLDLAQAQLAAAQADNTGKVTPAQIQALQGQYDQAEAVANSTNALIGPNQDKLNAETGLTQAQTALTAGPQSDYYRALAAQSNSQSTLNQSQADLNKALLAGAPAGQAATTAQAAGAGAASQAQAAATLAGIQQAQQGPLYGLQERVNAIKNLVFGPGGSGDPQDANDLLQQYVTSSVAGTTPYAANVAAANAGLTAFGTQASLANAAGAAAAQRAQALSSYGGQALGALSAMNVNAPKGSTLLAGAFQDVVNMMADRMSSGAFAPSQQPTAPTLPAILQKLAPGGVSAVQPAGGGGSMGAALGGAASLPMPQVTPNAGASNPLAASGLQGASPGAGASSGNNTMPNITFNFGGSSPNQVPGQSYGAQTAYTGGVAPWNAQPGLSMPSAPQQPWTPPQQSTMNVGAMPGAGPGGVQSSQMPGVLQQYSPPTLDSVHQLWSKELGSGAVQSPYAAMQQQIAAPQPAAV